MTLSEAQKRKIKEEEKYRVELRGKFSNEMPRKSKRSRIVASLLAIFFGGFGLHKFYLGMVSWGITYLLLSWTTIPMLVGIFEGIMYLFMTNKSFELKYQ